jgi:hypothetical protein
VAGPACAGEIDEELGRVDGRLLRQLGRHPLLPARLRLRAHPQPLAAQEDAELLEIGGLEQHRFGLGRDLGFLAAHDPGHGHRTLGIRDHEVLGRQLPRGAVEGADRLTRPGAAHDDPSFGQLGVVEGV